jgi:phosphate transport system permease protein
MATLKKSINWLLIKEKIIELFFLTHGILAVVVLIGIFSLLLMLGLPAIKQIGFKDLFLNANWNPTSPQKESFGLLSLILSTLMVSGGALIIAVPLGVACAAYLADVAHPRTREIIKPIVEILAGIPSVVVGFLGIVLTGPLLADLFGISNGLNALNGSILLAIMALPTIISISEDAIIAVPQDLKSASLALGATRWQTLVRVTLPAASSGTIAAVMLGMGRAIGETMTVLMACGNATALPNSFLDPVRTMTATIAIELGETAQKSTHYHSLFIVALALFIMTFAFNMISDAVLHKYQKAQR